jgi:hypothetical protein
VLGSDNFQTVVANIWNEGDSQLIVARQQSKLSKTTVPLIMNKKLVVFLANENVSA